MTSRKIFIPVVNNTDENISLRRGTVLGDTVEIEENNLDFNHVATITLAERTVDGKAIHTG